MKRTVLLVFGTVAITGSMLLAQAPADAIEKALVAAPRQAREGATVIKWNPDNTYETLRKGTNTWICYDQSGLPTEQPYSVQCTSAANLERVVQNRKFETIADAKERQAALAKAEADGSRVKPEYGSAFITVSGKDASVTRTHITIALPGATSASTGLPDNNKQGGAWIMSAGTSSAHIMIPGS